MACWLSVIAMIITGCAARTRIENPTLADRIENDSSLRREAIRDVGRVEDPDDPVELTKRHR